MFLSKANYWTLFSNRGERIEMQSTTTHTSTGTIPPKNFCIRRNSFASPSLPDFALHSLNGKVCINLDTSAPGSQGQFQPPLSLGMHPFATHPAAHCILSAEDQEVAISGERRKCDVVHISNSTRSGSCTDVESTRTAPSRICSSP